MKSGEIWKIKNSYPGTCFVKIYYFNEGRNEVELVNCDESGKEYGESYIQKIGVFLDWYKLCYTPTEKENSRIDLPKNGLE